MGRVNQLIEAKKAEISTLKDYLHMSNRQIGKEINRSEKVVRSFLRNRENYGQNYKTGRPTVVSAAKSDDFDSNSIKLVVAPEPVHEPSISEPDGGHIFLEKEMHNDDTRTGKGAYSFTAMDGQTYWIKYNVDGNGFHPNDDGPQNSNLNDALD
ncbi:uncharacterized protein LOC116343036 [Contarinia nasturtii]|uniref:uncharacterized protein LOC116343036 n=1 Tax=Contarinia nasturtii TaxID=265458 RepID=UPI0012D38C47|nr:uncharacterized protein LOC116343036 [Contarinia nasturtii]